MIGKGIRYLKGIKKEINNLSFIRKNQERDFRKKQFETILSDPKVRE